jgi:type II secretory pathway pseudopilin PulG
VTFMQRINARIEARKTGEQGLALLDVLLGMAIFALIVVIGVQNFSTLRNRAYTTQVSSDVKQVATAVQAAMTAPNATIDSLDRQSAAGPPVVTGDADTVFSTGDLDATGLSALGVNLTAGNAVGNAAKVGTDQFTVCVQRGASGPSAVYTSANSQVVTAAGGC